MTAVLSSPARTEAEYRTNPSGTVASVIDAKLGKDVGEIIMTYVVICSPLSCNEASTGPARHSH
jgi:hypothetical protein